MQFEDVLQAEQQMQWQSASAQYHPLHPGGNSGSVGLQTAGTMYAEMQAPEMAPAEHSSIQTDQAHFHGHHQQFYQSSPVSQHGLSINISGLSMATPPNLSPVNNYNTKSLHQSHMPGSSPSHNMTAGSSPTHHISPDPFGHVAQQHYPLQHHVQPNPMIQHPHQAQMAQPRQLQQTQLSFSEDGSMPPPLTQRQPQSRTVSTSLRSWQSAEDANASGVLEMGASVPHKRSFTSGQLPLSSPTSTSPSSLTPSMSETLYESMGDARRQAHFRPRLQIPDFVGGSGGEASPLDGPGSGSVYSNIGDEFDDIYSPIAENNEPGPTLKPTGTNNFVSKLFGMLSEPKASHYISWSEHGNSFIVSGVGEFSRNILGSHFKHNNFSSFVRQLNMYGFHKINRTPRSVTRGNVDGQIWEFMHQNFKRDRPDMLDDVRRRMPDEAGNSRGKFNLVNDLPGEIQLLRDENRSMKEALSTQQDRLDKVVGAFQTLWEAVQTLVPGALPAQFPKEISREPRESVEMPDIRLSTSFAPRGSSSLGRSPTAEHPRRKSQSQSRAQNRTITRKTSLQQVVYKSHSSSPIEERMQEEEDGDAHGHTKRQRRSQENLRNSASPDSKFCFTPPMETANSDSIVPSIRSRRDSAPMEHSLAPGRPASRSNAATVVNSTPQIPQIGILLPPRPGMGTKHASN